MVAIQLGMVDEAKSLYEGSNRFDLYSKICQSNGEIDKSIEISEKQDRINLKNTYYNAAKFYEASNRFDQAIEFYEKSNTHIKEVPRMFM
jgi:intraflagellar transport protein 140